jgi:hypothetical protein
LDEIAAEFADGALPTSMVRTMTEKVTAGLARVDAEMAEGHNGNADRARTSAG